MQQNTRQHKFKAGTRGLSLSVSPTHPHNTDTKHTKHANTHARTRGAHAPTYPPHHTHTPGATPLKEAFEALRQSCAPHLAQGKDGDNGFKAQSRWRQLLHSNLRRRVRLVRTPPVSLSVCMSVSQCVYMALYVRRVCERAHTSTHTHRERAREREKVCVCVCVRERVREREGERERETYQYLTPCLVWRLWPWPPLSVPLAHAGTFQSRLPQSRQSMLRCIVLVCCAWTLSGENTSVLVRLDAPVPSS